MSTRNVIAIDVRYKKSLESLAGGTVYPGFLLEKSGSNFIAHSSAGGNADFVADMLMEESIADSIASTERLKVFPFQPGDIAHLYLTTSQTITKGEEITSNGDGYVKTASDGATAIGNATNYVTFTPLNGNFVSASFVDPSASTQALAVTISGGNIVVSLATDGSSAITSVPADIVTAYEAVSGDEKLASAVATGTAAVIANAVESFQADAVIGYAEEAVTTTSTAARLEVRKGV